MRRLIIEEPYSRAALWSRRLALFSLAVGAIAVLLARSQAVDPTATLSVFAGAVLVACLALLFAGTAAVVIWRTGRRGAGTVASGVFLAALLLGYPAYLAAKAVQLPLLNDVSTDLVDPPQFSRSKTALAARSQRTPEIPPPQVRQEQRLAYPNIQPILLDQEADEAYQLVLRAIAARGWKLVEQTPPGGRIGVGHIDAIDRTLIMGFPADVTIRMRPLAGQTRVDVRSVSRVGRHDYGSNAQRIEKFAAEIQAQLDAAK
ncbi:MAG TPA: DUF1499 domain-containing protein [Beijerinckiaceae bacterium]|jgi:uncharacterized protein (DUF1499 family)|nr:DUF1499 domain-containing protein [Beijerinckiaceae bacterium]